MKRNIFLLTLLVVVALGVAPVMAPIPPVAICKEAYCMGTPGWFSDDPPYYVGQKYLWWIRITVTANVALSNVVVYDRLGAELMIEGICEDTAKYDPYDYDFAYDSYGWNGEVEINGVSEGYLNKEGVSFGSRPFAFNIFWIGNSVKAHFMWDIGDMGEATSKTIFLVVSTDTNPAGQQEYTSCGWYDLNSGATVKAMVAGKQYSAETESIRIYVECD